MNLDLNTSELLAKWSSIERHRCVWITNTSMYLIRIDAKFDLIEASPYANPNLSSKERALLLESVSQAIAQDPDLQYTLKQLKTNRTFYKATITDTNLNFEEEAQAKDSVDAMLCAYLNIRESQTNLAV